MKLDLKLITEQLTEALSLEDGFYVAPIIVHEYDEFIGWHIVKYGENGEVIPMLGTKCKTLKELFENFYENNN